MSCLKKISGHKWKLEYGKNILNTSNFCAARVGETHETGLFCEFRYANSNGVGIPKVISFNHKNIVA